MNTTDDSKTIFQKIKYKLTPPCVGNIFAVGGLTMLFIYVNMGIVFLNYPELLDAAPDYYKAVSDFSLICLCSMFLTACYYYDKSMVKRYLSDLKTWKDFYYEHNNEHKAEIAD